MKNFKSIPVCYHPTTLTLIDDNKDFLRPLCLSLVENADLICRFYTDPRKALFDLNAKNETQLFIDRCISNEDSDIVDHVTLDLNFKTIHEEIYNSDRFKQITLSVVDYGMPSINGAEFCQKIIDNSIKKILLTGEADHSLALDLFNEGLIHQFVSKTNCDLTQLLQSDIFKLQQQFFLNMSSIVLGDQMQRTTSRFQILQEPEYINLFNKVYTESNAVEFYLLDAEGSFLFLDADAKPQWLILVSEEEMSSYLMIAQHGGASQKIINMLKTKTHLPYFHSESDKRTPPNEWNTYLHPAKLLKGNKNYYYAHITSENNYDIKSQNILSYKEYLNDHYKPELDKLLVA